MSGKSYSLVPSVTRDEVLFSRDSFLPEGLFFDVATGVIEGIPIDFYAKSSVLIQTRNDVNSASFALQITVLPFSLPVLILIPVVILILIVIISLMCLSNHKNHLLVHSMEELKKKLPQPVKAETPVVMASSSQNITIVPQSVVVEKESVSQPVQPHQSVSAYTPQSLAQNANPLPPMEKTSSVYGLPIRRVTQTKHLLLKRPYLRNHVIYERISLLLIQRRMSTFL